MVGQNQSTGMSIVPGSNLSIFHISLDLLDQSETEISEDQLEPYHDHSILNLPHLQAQRPHVKAFFPNMYKLRTTLTSVRANTVTAYLPIRNYANSNEGRKGPLTGQAKQPKPNEGRKGPLTGQKRSKESSSSSSSEDKSPQRSQSTQGAESSEAPKTAPGQGVEDRGGHAMPSGPGEDGKFAEQGHSALEVSGAGSSKVGNENEAGRDQKVDPKFWSEK